MGGFRDSGRTGGRGLPRLKAKWRRATEQGEQGRDARGWGPNARPMKLAAAASQRSTVGGHGRTHQPRPARQRRHKAAASVRQLGSQAGPVCQQRGERGGGGQQGRHVKLRGEEERGGGTPVRVGAGAAPLPPCRDPTWPAPANSARASCGEAAAAPARPREATAARPRALPLSTASSSSPQLTWGEEGV